MRTLKGSVPPPNPALAKRIDSVNLDEVLFYMSDYGNGPRWNRVACREIEKLYRQFLYILIEAKGFRPVPTDHIDSYWHAHVLMTKKYEADCRFLCGRILHHDPLFGTRTAKERKHYNKCKAMTLNAFEGYFGTTLAMD